MQAYLVAFTVPGGRYGLTYGSHVVTLDGPPRTVEAVMDLLSTIAMEYESKVASLVNWELLPDAESHPGISPYCYFVTYARIGEHGINGGCTTMLQDQPICTLEDVRHIEEAIGSDPQMKAAWQGEIHLVCCKPLVGASASLLEKYERTHRPEDE